MNATADRVGHSSLPWEIYHTPCDICSVKDGHVTRTEIEADAAFIVLAVNAHEDLLAALIALRDAVKASGKMEGREYDQLGIQVNNAIAKATL